MITIRNTPASMIGHGLLFFSVLLGGTWAIFTVAPPPTAQNIPLAAAPVALRPASSKVNGSVVCWGRSIFSIKPRL